MKNLVKILVLAIGITAAAETSAQIFGIKGGLNLSTMHFDSDNEDLKMKTGFHFGPTVEFPASERFSFETGLLLSSKGVKFDVEEEGDGSLNLLYLDIPLTGKAYFDAGAARIYGLFGPYAGFGLTGKWKMDDYEVDVWGSDGDSDFKRLDFGLIAGAGIDLNSIQIGVNYALGLANISDGGGTSNNRVIGISVGYKFSGN